jgi:hypothetical protein
MADLETKVRVSAKTQGFDKVQQESAKLQATQKVLFQAAKQGFSDSKKSVTEYRKLMGNLETQLQATAKAQIELQESISETSKSSEVYKKLTDEMKRLDQQSNQVRKTIGLVEQAFRSEAKAARESAAASGQAGGAFRQGFAQGAGMGEFVQRGPGMGRQLAGRFAGGAAVGAPMGVAKGIASMPFQGLQGLAGGLQQAGAAIPLGLGIPAVLGATTMMQAAGMAGPAVQFQRQRLESAPFLRGMFNQEGAAGAARQKNLAANRLTREAIEQRAKAAGDVAAGRVPVRPETQGGFFSLGATAQGVRSGIARGAAGIESPETVRKRAENVERTRLQGEARKFGIADTERIGKRFGMAIPETNELAASISQVGGGQGREMLGKGGFLETAAAAKRMGIGPEVSGAFLQAQRRGGIAGVTPGQGVGSSQMVDAFSDATKMGLEGSEVNEYLAVIAEGISSWKTTGIPVAKDAIAGIGLSISQKGLSGVRGAAIAQNIVGAAQGLSRGGPQSATQLMMLQTMGGFKGGGGAGLEEAQIQLEQLQGDKGKMGKKGEEFIRRVIQGYGGERTGARAELAQMGINFGAKEFKLYGKQLMGEKLSRTEQKDLERERKLREGTAAGAPSGVAGFQALAESFKSYAKDIDKTVAIQDEQLRIGTDMITTLNNLDGAMNNLVIGFDHLAGDPLKNLTDAIEKATQAAAGKKGMMESVSEALGISTQ